jgi:hypothetical protein
LVLEEIYLAANKGRPEFLSEIKPLKMTLEGLAPKLRSIHVCSDQLHKQEELDKDKDFFVEGDVEL